MDRLPISTKDLCEELCRRASTENIVIFGKSLSEILDIVCQELAEEQEWEEYELASPEVNRGRITLVRIRRVK
jgi:hypothetical protein